MKTTRLLYQDYLSGGLQIYHFGANLPQYILPQNVNQPLIKVDTVLPDGKKRDRGCGIYARADVVAGVKDATDKIPRENTDKIITIGGTCFVSLT
jgi:arginase